MGGRTDRHLYKSGNVYGQKEYEKFLHIPNIREMQIQITISHLSVWPSKRTQVTNVAKMWRKFFLSFGLF